MNKINYIFFRIMFLVAVIFLLLLPALIFSAEKCDLPEKGKLAPPVGQQVVISDFEIDGVHFSWNDLINEDQIRSEIEIENGLVLINNQGSHLIVRVIKDSEHTYVNIGNSTYYIRDPNKVVNISDINAIGNPSFLSFIGSSVKKFCNDKNVSFGLVVDPVEMTGSLVMLPVHPNHQPWLVSKRNEKEEKKKKNPIRQFINNEVLDSSLGYSRRMKLGINLEKVLRSDEFFEYLHHLSIIATYGTEQMVESGNDEFYYDAVERLNKMKDKAKEMNLDDRYLKIVNLIDYLLLSISGCDFERYLDKQNEIRAERAGSENAVIEKKAFHELPVDPNRISVPKDELADWEVDKIIILKPDDPRFDTIDDNVDESEFRDDGINELQGPFLGGAATTVKLQIGDNKIVHPALLIELEIHENGKKFIEQRWISIAEARFAFMHGLNPKAEIYSVTNVGGPLEGETHDSIRKILHTTYANHVAMGWMHPIIQRAGLLLDQEGNPVRYPSGHLAVCAEDHLFAGLAAPMFDRDYILKKARTTDLIFVPGNGDNVLNYRRHAMLKPIKEARNKKGTNPIFTTLAATPLTTDIHKKGGIIVEVIYKNKKTGKTISNIECREFPEFYTRKGSGLDGNKVDDPDRIKELEGWFIEDLIGEDKQVLANNNFFSYDGKLFLARIFDIDETLEQIAFADELEKISPEEWGRKIREYIDKVHRIKQTSKKVPTEDGKTTVKGILDEQKIQDAIVNGRGPLNRVGKPNLDVRVVLTPNQEKIFLPYKGTTINRTDPETGEVTEVYDLEYYQSAYVKAVEEAIANRRQPILGSNTLIRRVIPVTKEQIIRATAVMREIENVGELAPRLFLNEVLVGMESL
ncbi:MAG: hypothetical protein ABII27_02935 [bacterium]